MEAMAAGCVAVLHPRYAEIFGAAAVYCEAPEVVSVIDGLVADHARFRLQSRAGREFVENAYRPAQYVESLAKASR
jgi:hypothetical protein